MRQTFVSLIMLIFLISVKCQNKAIVAPQKLGNDTTRTLAVHMNYGLRSVRWGVVNRIVADSLVWRGVDSITMKKEVSKITYYEIVVDVVVDSALSRQFNVPLLDGLGKPNVINLKMNAEAKYVVEPVTDLDSAIKHLQQYIVKDSVMKK
jgi:hypothetical protein